MDLDAKGEMRDLMVYDGLWEIFYGYHMGLTAENIAKVYNISRQEQDERMQELRGDRQEIGFGSQIRSYTLHPAQRVKDHRTEVEVGNAEGVLDGDIDRFIRAALLEESVRSADA